MIRAIVLSASMWAAVCVIAQQPSFDGKTWTHHLEVLAADDMEGRGTGTPGLQRAEAYVVDQLRKAGVAPAGTHSYYQRIKFESREVVETDSRAALVRDGKAQPLVLGEDAVFAPLADLAHNVEAPLVFLGYGASDAEKSYDDFASLDFKGKVAVIIAAAPPVRINAPTFEQRWRLFRNAGLIGWIAIAAPRSKWSGIQRSAAEPFTDLSGEEWNHSKGLKMFMYFNPARADKLFEGSGHTSTELFALVNDRKPLPLFALPVSIRSRARMLKRVFRIGERSGKDRGHRSEA